MGFSTYGHDMQCPYITKRLRMHQSPQMVFVSPVNQGQDWMRQELKLEFRRLTPQGASHFQILYNTVYILLEF